MEMIRSEGHHYEWVLLVFMKADLQERAEERDSVDKV